MNNTVNFYIWSNKYTATLKAIKSDLLLTCKMKYWREYCLVKYKRKKFGGINIGDLDKIISYTCLICSLKFILICVCVCCPSGVVGKEAKAPCGIFAYIHPFFS